MPHAVIGRRLSGCIFEPTLLREYSWNRTKRENGRTFELIYFKYLLPITLAIYILSTALIVSIYYVYNLYSISISIKWTDIWPLFKVLFDAFYDWWSLGFFGFFLILTITWFWGVTGSQNFDLTIGAAGSSAVLAIGFTLFYFYILMIFWMQMNSSEITEDSILAPALIGLGFSIGFGSGLGWGLVSKSSIISSTITSIILAFLFGPILGYFANLSINEGTVEADKIKQLGDNFWIFGLCLGLGLSIGFLIGKYRIVFYPFYWVGIFKKYSLIKNPYISDACIRLPLPWVKNTLKKEASIDPNVAFKFINFLLHYRPFQHGLAAELEHIATAARWKSTLRLQAEQFEEFYYLKEGLPKDWDKYTPSEAWRKKLTELHKTLRSAETQTAVVLKKQFYEQCAQHLFEFGEIHKRETFKGSVAYFEVIKHWKTIFANQLREVNQEVARVETITTNPYSKGYALSPDTPGNVPLFLDRRDIKEELTLKIQTSESMPTFLILGQRRVGKTSLLNFLPSLLDASSFLVVSMDAQSMSGELSISKWLLEWRFRILTKLKLDYPEWSPPENTLVAWDEFAQFLNNITKGNQRRIILAMDEYDEDLGFQRALQHDPEIGKALLSRIRAFSQSQKRVVFMFIGATNFSDLPEPKWSRYFVHSYTLWVDYLSEPSSIQLITNPSDGFKLEYEEDVIENIYNMTQGHPHLLQSICSELVDYANKEVRRRINQDDLTMILREKIVRSGEQPFSVFWDEFCEKMEMRRTVLSIAKGEPVDHSSVEVRRLLDYKYIVEKLDGGFQMRVPLFAEWVLKFGYLE